MDLLKKIQRCFKNNLILYTQHAKSEMQMEESGKIFDNEISEAVCEGKLIEEYVDDKPYPSILIYGRTQGERSLHIVCAFDEKEKLAIVITAYQPNPELWIGDKRRKK